jgi:hypothetical protein
MTVCLAALTENSRAICCIADKGISYGDHIQWDSDGTKMAQINTKGTTIMFSGAEDDTSRVLSRLIARGEEIGDDAEETRKICEGEYGLARDELIEIKLLNPNLLNRSEYLTALKGASLNSHILSIAKRIEAFEMNCAFLVCGFDKDHKPYILDLEPPGLATNFITTGFHAIFSGLYKAVARLLFSEHKRTDPAHRVIYDLFDAKANAEMAAGVGFEWDAEILYAGREIFRFTDEPKKMFEKIWAKFNRSPFDKRKKDDLPPPPHDWRAAVTDFSSQIETVSMVGMAWPKSRVITISVKKSKP